MKEKVLLLSAKKSLVGVLTDPPLALPGQRSPAVILLNAGLLHRSGPNRLYVKIARNLAAAGFVTLRFDFSGIGDSEVRGDNLSFEQSVMLETQEVMDYLTATRSVQQFILMGICSGADNALRVASKDKRVVGCALIDAHAFPSWSYFFDSYRGRLLSAKSWWQFFTGKSDLWGIMRNFPRYLLKTSQGQTTSVEVQNGHKPLAQAITDNIHSLVARGVHLLFIYSGTSPSYYYYRARLKKELDQLQSTGKVRLRYLKESDHIFTLLSDQQWLVGEIHDWITGLNGNTVAEVGLASAQG